MFHAGEEDLQAFWNLHREAQDLQKIAAQAQQHTMKPNQEREINNERHHKSLRQLVSRAPCWESEHEPVITFFTNVAMNGVFRSSACWQRNTRLGIKRWPSSGKALKCESRGRVRATSSWHLRKGARLALKRMVRISFRWR